MNLSEDEIVTSITSWKNEVISAVKPIETVIISVGSGHSAEQQSPSFSNNTGQTTILNDENKLTQSNDKFLVTADLNHQLNLKR